MGNLFCENGENDCKNTYVFFDNKKNNQLDIKRKIIWIDPNINNNENLNIKNKIEKKLPKDSILLTFENLRNAMKEIISIKFIKTFIILSAKLINDFNSEINKNIINIYTLPEVIIFTSEATKISIKNNPPKFPFFNKNLVFYRIKDLITYITEMDNMYLYININNDDMINSNQILNDNNYFTFEYITSIKELILPIRYSSFIWTPSKSEIDKFNKNIIDQYQNCYSDLNLFINQLLVDYEIPIEILVKYWFRLYSFNKPMVYLKINEGLRNGNEEFDIFTRVAYTGLRLNGIKSLVDKTLYRGSKISIEEIQKIQNSIENKNKTKKEFPECICYCNSFLSFSENIDVGFKFMNDNKLLLKKMRI